MQRSILPAICPWALPAKFTMLTPVTTSSEPPPRASSRAGSARRTRTTDLSVLAARNGRREASHEAQSGDGARARSGALDCLLPDARAQADREEHGVCALRSGRRQRHLLLASHGQCERRSERSARLLRMRRSRCARRRTQGKGNRVRFRSCGSDLAVARGVAQRSRRGKAVPLSRGRDAPLPALAAVRLMAGYSGTPLAQKLGIKPGDMVLSIDAPKEYRAWLGDLP